MVITSLRKGKKANKFLIFLDGNYGFSVELDTLIKENLYEGKTLTEDEILTIKDANEIEYWYHRVLNLIARRPRSESEVRTYLKDKLYDSEAQVETVINTIVDRLAEYNYVNDREFAQWFIENRVAFKKKSKREIEMELKKKGVSRDVITEIMGQAYDSEEETRIITQLIEKKTEYFNRKTSTPKESKQKLIEFLLRKGFRWEVIQKHLS